MKLKIDKESDALYFWLDDDEIVESEEVQTGIILDFDENGRLVGIEILSLSTRFAPEKLRVMQFETAWFTVVADVCGVGNGRFSMLYLKP